MTDEEKKRKMENSFRGDRLLAVTEAHNNTNFSEIREWRGPDEDEILVRFVFTTKVWNKFIEEEHVFQKLTFPSCNFDKPENRYENDA